MRVTGSDFSSGPPILRGAKGGDFELFFNWSLDAEL